MSGQCLINFKLVLGVFISVVCRVNVAHNLECIFDYNYYLFFN